ncbi:MAG: hypothetical protein JWO98_2426 [Frankiales bacterium]|nr:hypothetical protein [Frankiales bacterium]
MLAAVVSVPQVLDPGGREAGLNVLESDGVPGVVGADGLAQEPVVVQDPDLDRWNIPVYRLVTVILMRGGLRDIESGSRVGSECRVQQLPQLVELIR